ncbi:hypothetical protein ACEQ8H_005891 [Pleosporales sp. CAS-2024a]
MPPLWFLRALEERDLDGQRERQRQRDAQRNPSTKFKLPIPLLRPATSSSSGPSTRPPTSTTARSAASATSSAVKTAGFTTTTTNNNKDDAGARDPAAQTGHEEAKLQLQQQQQQKEKERRGEGGEQARFAGAVVTEVEQEARKAAETADRILGVKGTCSVTPGTKQIHLTLDLDHDAHPGSKTVPPLWPDPFADPVVPSTQSKYDECTPAHVTEEGPNWRRRRWKRIVSAPFALFKKTGDSPATKDQIRFSTRVFVDPESHKEYTRNEALDMHMAGPAAYMDRVEWRPARVKYYRKADAKAKKSMKKLEEDTWHSSQNSSTHLSPIYKIRGLPEYRNPFSTPRRSFHELEEVSPKTTYDGVKPTAQVRFHDTQAKDAQVTSVWSDCRLPDRTHDSAIAFSNEKRSASPFTWKRPGEAVKHHPAPGLVVVGKQTEWDRLSKHHQHPGPAPRPHVTSRYNSYISSDYSIVTNPYAGAPLPRPTYSDHAVAGASATHQDRRGVTRHLFGVEQDSARAYGGPQAPSSLANFVSGERPSLTAGQQHVNKSSRASRHSNERKTPRDTTLAAPTVYSPPGESQRGHGRHGGEATPETDGEPGSSWSKHGVDSGSRQRWMVESRDVRDEKEEKEEALETEAARWFQNVRSWRDI